MATFFFFFFFFFLEPRVKLDEKSIENGLEGQKFLVVCLFWGGCHHPNTGLESLSHFRSVSPRLMSFHEKAFVSTEKLTNPSEVQSELHLPLDMVLGQLVTERIGLENGIVLSFSR